MPLPTRANADMNAPSMDDVVLLAGDLRIAFDVCRALDDKLIGLSTSTPGTKSATTGKTQSTE